ncbi:MAG: type 4a pilus biogenesis protein PilO [Pseudomonadota bacterium]|nr:type 4a pilus biogenesis protein PilO [Pseudomonadota bacterium]
MATSAPTTSFDVTGFVDQATSQFRNLNTKEPGQWPALPKAAAFLVAALVVVAMGWFLLLSDSTAQLEAARAREPGLKADYRSRLAQAVNLNELRKQKLQVQEFVTQLEKQLPGKAEMDALLSDINQAGLGRGLQFELFRPGQVQVKDYYAELPISIRVSGKYHDIGAFAADVANLSRIVTLQNLSIAPAVNPGSREPGPTGNLAMDATARTYRYLDQAEIDEQRKVASKTKTAGAKK